MKLRPEGISHAHSPVLFDVRIFSGYLILTSVDVILNWALWLNICCGEYSKVKMTIRRKCYRTKGFNLENNEGCLKVNDKSILVEKSARMYTALAY